MKLSNARRIIVLGLVLFVAVGFLTTIRANASLENPSKADVTIAKMAEPYKAHFPDVVLIPQDKLPVAEQADYPNGKLLVAFYKNTGHVPAVPDLDGMGRIQAVESKDNGRTWSQPEDMMTPQQLLDYGIATEEKLLESRDPNFAILSDGTVIFTFFTRHTASDGYVKPYIMYSRDGANTWSEPTLIPSQILNQWSAKRGDIAVFDDDQMLIPIYGAGDTVSGTAAVNILATLKPDGSILATWSVIRSSYPGRPIYAKRFFPDLGWDATTAQLVFRNLSNGDMGDPSGCLLANGEVLVLYYNTRDRSISGTFLDPDDLVPEELINDAEQEAPIDAELGDEPAKNAPSAPHPILWIVIGIVAVAVVGVVWLIIVKKKN